MTPDLINGLFEFAGGFFILDHCRKLFAAKDSSAVSLASTMFFGLWGVWNLFYYPFLNQWWSFAGGLLITAANTLWIALIIKYRKPT